MATDPRVNKPTPKATTKTTSAINTPAIGASSPYGSGTITGNERNIAKEREALNLGYSQDYITSRGGINSQGYFNDTPLSGQLTAEERKQVTLPNGTTDTAAMAQILQKKQIAELVSQGMSEADATSKVASGYGQYGISGAGTTGASTGTSTSLTGAGTPEQQAARQSAYDLLLQEFTRYGLESLVSPLKSLIMENVSPAEFGLRLTQTDAYKKRFAANADRIAKGLVALSPAEYIAMEDQYQNIMRNYGLPASYYTKDSLGTQAGFNQLLANDVSAAELEDRVVTAQNRVLNAPPQVQEALKQFYPGITNGDILAYTLDPTNALADIKRKVSAAEIGGAAIGQGLSTSEARAKELANYGITAQQARQGYADVAQIAPRGSQLAQFYGQSPYDQTAAEQEIFNLAGSAEATQKRKKLTELEQAQFAGKSGGASNALSRDRAVSPYMLGIPGAGAY